MQRDRGIKMNKSRNVNTIKWLIMAVILIIFSAFLPAGRVHGFFPGPDSWRPDNLHNQVKRAGERFPGADAVILSESTVITMDGGGLVSRRCHRVVALFTDNAIRMYGDPRILYNTETQELDVSIARIYMRDGTAVDTENNGFNQTTPFPLALTPDYADWQEMVVTHVGVEKRCVAELDYTISDKRRVVKRLSGVEHMAAEDPTLLRTLEIRLPGDARLKYVSISGAPEPEIPGGGVYKWRVEEIPGNLPGGDGVWEGDHLPTVCYSTAESWEEVLRDVAAGIGEADQRPASISVLVEDAVKEARTDEERVLNIHDAALGCVRSVDAPFALFADQPRGADRIFESAYAHSLDRAVLLSAMLREAGFESVPVLAASGKSWPGDVPVLQVFSRIFLEVSLGEGGDDELLLDPGEPFVRDPRMSISGLNVARCRGGRGIVHVPERKADENKSSLDLTIVFDGEGGIEGEGVAVLTGAFSPYYAIRGVGDETETFIKGGVGDMFSGAVIESWNLNKLEKGHVEFGFRFKASASREKTDTRMYFRIPRPLEADVSGMGMVHVERSTCPTPIRLVPCVLDVSCAFEGPPGWRFAVMPAPDDEKNPIGSIITDSVPGTNGGVNFNRRLVINKDFIRGEDYGMLRSLLLKFGEDRVVLEKR